MDIVTLEEMLESLKENIEAELGSQGLPSWTIGASGNNFGESLSGYSTADLEQLKEEILEGAKVEVTIDLSDAVVEYLDTLLDQAEKDKLDETDDEDEDYDLDDEDDDYDSEG